MTRLRAWLYRGADGSHSPATSFVLALLIVNALPAFVVLQSVPGDTEHWFVWTIAPTANARVLGVMYGNAFLLAAAGWHARTWLRLRVAMAVVAPFSVAATLVTFLTLDPFLKHPWYELAYWIANYVALLLLAPLVFVLEERAHGGRLQAEAPMVPLARGALALAAAALLLYGASLLFELSTVSTLWPFAITPLVARILGVWLGSLGLAHAWAAWDGDRDRALPLVAAMPITGALLLLVPLLHGDDLRHSASAALACYLALAAGVAATGLTPLLSRRDPS